jgi:ketosteroid isomerase-like protein
MSEARVSIVRSIFQAAMRHGPLAGVALIPDDMTWVPFGGSGVVLHGRAEVQRFYRDLEGRGDRFEPYATDFESVGDHVLVTGSARVHPGTGGFRESSLVWVFSFAGERLASETAYPTRADALAAIGDAESCAAA